MLNVINDYLNSVLSFNNRTLTDIERIEYFITQGKEEFSRRDYMSIFKDISSATASRDLKKGINLKYFDKHGEKNKTIYNVIKENLA